MDAHVNDSKINLCEKSIKNQEKKRKEHKTLIANLLHQNNLIPEKMHPFQMPLNKHQTQSKSLPLFDSDNLKLGNKLGNGSQSVVYEVKSFSSTPSKSQFNKQNEEWIWINNHDRKSNLVHSNIQCKQQVSQDFAVKLPRYDDKEYKKHVEQLIHESKILSSVDHPNIIKIHGRSSIEASQLGSNRSAQPFFLVLDRLTYTLEDLLKVWVPKKNNDNTLKFQSFKYLVSLRQRLKIAFNIATAMNHLHKKNIMHRDLKPGNIGFDSQGKLKLFDFGYATKLLQNDHLPDGTYKMEGGIGTCRYMAPEVARFEPYNELADVYSFGILLWELLSLEKPYEDLTYKNWFQQVVVKKERPDIKESWPTKLQYLLKCCWSDDINERPSFDIIIDVLDEVSA